ncbi:MAG: F0F1 ATP synthase subunit A [Chloroflexi bacterium]|nr:F0F1 ATP synthase subunit A [Chloroflexota bacterium]MCY4246113.1 F0F1 ATP synthase subunit A [Chloroflexota bacterium]
MNSFWNGKRRYIALLLFLAGVFVALVVPPVIPFIQLAGENLPSGYDIPFTDIRITNTFVAAVIVWILLLLFTVYIARRRPSDGGEVPPGGFYNMFEALYEGLMGFIGGIAGGAHFRLIFNMFMTIFLIVLLSNWMSLVPGIDTVGFIHPHTKEKFDPETEEYKVITTDGFEIYQGFLGISYVNGQCDWISPADEAAADQAALAEAEAAGLAAQQTQIEDAAYARYQAAHGEHGASEHTDEAGGDHGEDSHGEEAVESAATAMDDEVLAARIAEKQARANRGCYTGVALAPWQDGYSDDKDAKKKPIPLHPDPSSEEAKRVPWVVLPLVRVASTDLNMTLTLAIISVVMTQYIGFKALGIGYLTKFFNFGTLFKSPLGGIDVAVGLLELIGDFAKILSFSFRLLGAMFAGAILLFVMSFLVPILPWPFFILEFFVGAIQALVFALLTAIFMNLATISHHHDDDHDDDH